MAQVLVNVKMGEELKERMGQTCHDLGISLTTGFTIFAKKLSRKKRIPFEVSVDPFYSDKNLAAIKESVKEIE